MNNHKASFTPVDRPASPADATLARATPERRAEPRRRVQTEARISWIPPELLTVETAVPRSSSAITRDISLTGVSFFAEDPIDLGSICNIELKGLDGTLIRHRAEVMRCTALEAGFEVAVAFRGRIV